MIGASGRPTSLGDLRITSLQAGGKSGMPPIVSIPLALNTGGGGVATRFIAPTPAGDQSGTSWANAAPLSSIDTLIAAVGAGGRIYIMADGGTIADTGAAASGEYLVSSAIDLTHGGTLLHPVEIIGVNTDLSVPSDVTRLATIVSNRVDWTLPVNSETVSSDSTYAFGANPGSVIFDFKAGSDYLWFKNIRARRVGTLFNLNVDGAGKGLKATNITGYNMRRLVDGNGSRTIDNVTVSNFRVTGYSKALIRAQGNSTGWIIEDGVGNAGRQSGDQGGFSRLIAWDGTAHGMIARRLEAMNGTQDNGASYWQADGYEDNIGNYDNTWEDVSSHGNTDGGFDCKGTRDIFTRCNAYDNKRNMRLWSKDQTITDCAVGTPNGTRSAAGIGGPAHIYMTGTFGASDYNGTDGFDGIFTRLAITGDSDLIPSEGGPVARFVDCTVDVGSGVQALTAALASSLGLINPETVNHHIMFSTTAKSPAVISTSATASVTSSSPATIALTTVGAEEGNWRIVGGADVGLFSLSNYRTTVADLIMSPQTYAPGGDNDREVIVQFRDVRGQATNKTITISIAALTGNEIPSYIANSASLGLSSSASPSSITPPIPVGAAVDDIAILVALDTNASSAVYTGPAGWTQIGSTSVWWKRIAGGEADPTVVSTHATGSGSHCLIGMVYLFRNAYKLGNPIEGATALVGSGGNGSGVAINGEAITTTGSNRLRVHSFIGFNDYAGFDLTATALSNGWLNRSNELTTVGTDATITLETQDAASSGTANSQRAAAGQNPTTGRIGFALKPVNG